MSFNLPVTTITKTGNRFLTCFAPARVMCSLQLLLYVFHPAYYSRMKNIHFAVACYKLHVFKKAKSHLRLRKDLKLYPLYSQKIIDAP